MGGRLGGLAHVLLAALDEIHGVVALSLDAEVVVLVAQAYGAGGGGYTANGKQGKQNVCTHTLTGTPGHGHATEPWPAGASLQASFSADMLVCHAIAAPVTHQRTCRSACCTGFQAQLKTRCHGCLRGCPFSKSCCPSSRTPLFVCVHVCGHNAGM